MQELTRPVAVITALVVGAAACAPPRDVASTVVTVTNRPSILVEVADSSLSDEQKRAFGKAFARAAAGGRDDVTGRTVHDLIIDQERRDVAAALVAKDAESLDSHATEIAKYVEAEVTDVTPPHATAEHLRFTVRNVGPKAIRRLEVGIEIATRDEHRLGLAEFDTDEPVAPHASRTIAVDVPFSRFAAEGTWRLIEATGTAKRVATRVKEVRFADGTDVGYDD
jgi:hypothetical protein